jgi:syntaxin 18
MRAVAVAVDDRTRAFRAMCASTTSSSAVAMGRGAGLGERRAVREGDDDDDDDDKRVTCRTVVKYAETARRALETTRTYVETHGRGYKSASEGEKDAFEAETSESIRECQRCVDAAKEATERARRDGALRRAPQCAAHLYGIGLMLSDALNEVARTFDRVRETRFAETLARAERERQRARAARRATYVDPGAGGGHVGVSAVRVEDVETHAQTQTHGERQDDLERELTQLLDQVRAAEKNVVEMSALSSLFATHVQAQAEQIESLYQEAIDSSRNFDMGNVEMKKTIARKGDAQRYVAIILFIATLALLFLDWYSG